MNRHIFSYAAWIVVIGCMASGDTFTHRSTGKTFHGFATQKTNRQQTMVFNAEADKFEPTNLAEYDVVYNSQGRKNIVSVIPVQSPEILISEAVAREVADQIVMASNNGPRMIVIDIDNPGGSGEYMKIIASAIIGTNNCPIVGYISGGKYGGAYSAAALLALSCKKMYMAPSAAMGAVCPIVIPSAANLAADQNPLQLYNPPTLIAYRSFAASLARQTGRNEVLAMALMDPEMEVVEVKGTDGKLSFIDRRDRQPTETIVRSWTRASHADDTTAARPTPTQIATGRLALTSQDALASKMIDGIANSTADILKTLDAADAQIAENRGIDQVIRRFKANQKTVNGALANIDLLQKRADDLQKSILEVEEQIRTGTMTREYNTGIRDNSSDYIRSGSQYRRQEVPPIRDQRRYDSSVDRNRRPYGLHEGERITTDLPAMPLAPLIAQLNEVLINLTREYRRVISLAQRYPGTLPPDTSIALLQQKLDAATALQNDIRRRYYEPGLIR